MSEQLLEVRDLRVVYESDEETVHAVNGISFSIGKQETLGLVGETGAGKTTTALSILRLLPDRIGKITSGSITYRGEDLLAKTPAQMRKIRGESIAMIFQDPMTSLNPVLTVGDQILEALELMSFVKQHPSTLSGGQKQRLALGVALMHEASIIVLDEPTSGLDGTNMRNVSRMIRKLAKMGRTIIVITHDAECALACCERAIRLENGCITDDFQIRGAELLLDKIGYDKKEG